MATKKVLILYTSCRHEDAGSILPSITDATRDFGAVSLSSFDELTISIINQNLSIFDTANHCELSDFDVILLRGARFFETTAEIITALTTYCRTHHIKLLNEYDGSIRSKLSQMAHFASLGAPVPNTIFLNDAVKNHPKIIEQNLGYPCIMKATVAFGGNANFKVQNFAEIKKYQSDHPDLKFILQNFIENDGDYRLFMAGEEKALIHRQSSSKDIHVNNVDKGGKSRVCSLSEIPEQAIQDAESIMKSYHLSICGADIIIDKSTGNYYFLEINLFPGIDLGEESPILHTYLSQLPAPRSPKLDIIGRSATVKSSYFKEPVKARVDTGARTSSIWASNIYVDRGNMLNFTLFDPSSPLYDGKNHRHKDFKVAVVRNSTGQEEIRYRTTIPVEISGRKIRASFNLSNRSCNNHPILIGRRTLNKKFLVDPSSYEAGHSSQTPKHVHERALNQELSENPYQFHQKYQSKIVGSKK